MTPGRYSTEDGVWALLPFDTKRPDAVRRDGEMGVTRATYDQLVLSVESEITVRLDVAGIKAAQRRHRLVTDAANLLVAAQICRKVQNYQAVAASYFADANVKLRLFLESVGGYAEGQSGGEVVLGVGMALTDADLADSGLGLSVFASVRV